MVILVLNTQYATTELLTYRELVIYFICWTANS